MRRNTAICAYVQVVEKAKNRVELVVPARLFRVSGTRRLLSLKVTDPTPNGFKLVARKGQLLQEVRPASDNLRAFALIDFSGVRGDEGEQGVAPGHGKYCTRQGYQGQGAPGAPWRGGVTLHPAAKVLLCAIVCLFQRG